jgi:hypothetical protein
MTNEQFGGTGVQSSAVQPPALPAIPPLADPIPPDLVIPAGGITILPPLTAAPPTNPTPGQPVTFRVQINNIGILNSGADATVTIYSCTAPLSPLQTTSVSCTGATPLGSATVGNIDAGSSTTVDITGSFSAGDTYYVYGYVDSTGDTVDEDGDSASTVYDPARELNNITDLGTTVLVSSISDLEVRKTVSNPT